MSIFGKNLSDKEIEEARRNMSGPLDNKNFIDSFKNFWPVLVNKLLNTEVKNDENDK